MRDYLEPQDFDFHQRNLVEYRRPGETENTTGTFIERLYDDGVPSFLVEVHGPIKLVRVEIQHVLSITHTENGFPIVITDLPDRVTEISQAIDLYIAAHPDLGRVTYLVKGTFTIPGFGILLLSEWQKVVTMAGTENFLGFIPLPERTEYLWVQPTGPGLLKIGRTPWEKET